MISRIIKLLFSINYFLCIQLLDFLIRIVSINQLRIKPSFNIIFYHEIPDDFTNKFSSQMNFIAKHTTVVACNFTGPYKKGTSYTSVTFDDAFKSFHKNAYPILLQKNIAATVFVPTLYMGSKPAWITDKDSYSYNEIIMTETEIATTASDLFTYGSHTNSHCRLTDLTMQQQKQELSESQQTLQKILKTDIDLFAFPFGEYNKATLDISKQLGFKHIFRILPRNNFKNTFFRGRIEVYADEWSLEFRLKACGYYNWMPTAIAAKRLLKKILHRK